MISQENFQGYTCTSFLQNFKISLSCSNLLLEKFIISNFISTSVKDLRDSSEGNAETWPNGGGGAEGGEK